MASHKYDLCVVIPALNEELVIGGSLKALRPIIDLKHVYVVSDGSTDKTAEIAREHTKNVLALTENVGKAEALQALMTKFKLKEKYKYVLFSDADSRLSPNFLEEIKKYADTGAACIVGAVASDRHGLVSAYRTYDYWICNHIFKRAQSILQVITVAPGCASLYKSEVLDQLEFSRRTLTEDFDLTLQIYQKKLGAVIMAPKAKVITQDPLTLKDYWNQILRWYTGFWQNIALHKMYTPKHKVSLELYILILDGFGWIGILLFTLIKPLLFLQLLGSMYLLVMAVGLVVLLIERAWWAIPYVPGFGIFQILNAGAYLYSLIRVLVVPSKRLGWLQPTRYTSLSEEEDHVEKEA